MGNRSSTFKGFYNYNTKNEDKAENESHIYRSPENPNNDDHYSRLTLQAQIKKMFAENDPDANVLEDRIKDENGEPTSETQWITYGQYRELAESFGKGVLDLNLAEFKSEFRNYKLRFLGIYAGGSTRYLIQDLACILYNIVSVPIYDTLGEEATQFVFENTNLETLVLTMKHYQKMVEMKKEGKTTNLKNFIVIDCDSLTPQLKQEGTNAGLNVYTYQEIIETGRKNPSREWIPVGPKDIYCFSYTSGTTGTPKGVMLSQVNVASCVVCAGGLLNVTNKDKHLNYLPMAHIFERLITLVMLINGAPVALFGGNIRKIKDDLAIFKPTIFVSVPRLYNKFYDAIQTKVKGATGLKGKLLRHAIKTKLENLEEDGEITHKLYDALVFKKMKAILGGRVRVMVTGSAPLDKDVADFFKIAMCCPIVEGYGQTEGTGGEFIMNIRDTTSGHVGGVLKHLEFKLVDVPEMNYTHLDVCPETGLSTPRGEIWVRGHAIIPGYYKNEPKNRDTFTKDGWMKSGDIAMIAQPNKRVVIIDRKKNIFKLSQGEYIAPEKLEGAYKVITPLITDIYIYGDSLKSCLIAVLTIEDANRRALAQELEVCAEVDDEDLLAHPDFEKAILAMFKRQAKVNKFNGLEVPKGIIFNTVPFADLGLLTTSFKPKRNVIKGHFLEQLDERYKSLF